MTRFYDISRRLIEGMPVWPGDPPMEIERTTGKPAQSRLTLGTHVGTHVDPPAHFLPGGDTVDMLPLDVLVGPAWVAQFAGDGPITATDLDAAGIPAGVTRLLVRTENSARWPEQGEFSWRFVGLAAGTETWLLARDIRLIGIDGPSVEAFDLPGAPVHNALLGASVVIVENLALGEVAPGPYELICLPLKIAAGDGAPARVILRELRE